MASEPTAGFDIEITDPARDDIDAAVAFMAAESRLAAAQWKTALQALILSLQEMPNRFPLIAEASELLMPYRSVLHGSHRVVFRVDGDKNIVYVVRVYHGARRPLTPEDIDPRDED